MKKQRSKTGREGKETREGRKGEKTTGKRRPTG